MCICFGETHDHPNVFSVGQRYRVQTMRTRCCQGFCRHCVTVARYMCHERFFKRTNGLPKCVSSERTQANEPVYERVTWWWIIRTDRRVCFVDNSVGKINHSDTSNAEYRPLWSTVPFFKRAFARMHRIRNLYEIKLTRYGLAS